MGVSTPAVGGYIKKRSTNRRYKNKKKTKKKKRKSKTRKRNIKNKKGGDLTGEILKNEIHFDLNRRSRYCRR